MLFYRIGMESDRALESSEQRMRKTRARIKERTIEANEKCKGEMNFFVSDIQDRKITVGAAVFVGGQGPKPAGAQEGDGAVLRTTGAAWLCVADSAAPIFCKG